MLEEQIKQIKPLDEPSIQRAKARWKTVAKPLGSLGKLETAVVQMAGIKRTSQYTLERKGLIIMCADNGVVEEGVTQTGREVTAIVADNFTKKETSVAIMSDIAGVTLFPVDIGMAVDVPSVTKPEWKVAYGTKNLRHEPAMTRQEAERAIEIGIEMVRQRKEEGYDILATGEMGIGNTTTSSAVAAVLLAVPVEKVTGKGAGLSNQGLATKIKVIQEAIKMHKPDSNDAIDVISKVGGFDIAGLVGVFLGGAIYHIPVLIDGFISSVAALCATRISQDALGYMMASHVSKEPAGQMMLDALKMTPMLTCDMCLGEGSGAVSVLPVLEMGLAVYQQMSTFEEIHVDAYEEFGGQE